ncbi:uncharacterized protein J3D65DRAFT_614051 [Phyllosticta citribraziliensis]|uniref:Uncharacterized protein n=1 Tax=Phyllosticta citribraziliensis TaxID=989973 RepID=A0ABR1M4K0_9PEZI
MQTNVFCRQESRAARKRRHASRLCRFFIRLLVYVFPFRLAFTKICAQLRIAKRRRLPMGMARAASGRTVAGNTRFVGVMPVCDHRKCRLPESRVVVPTSHDDAAAPAAADGKQPYCLAKKELAELELGRRGGLGGEKGSGWMEPPGLETVD